MKEKLTESRIRAIRPRDKIYKVWDSEQPGLFLRVNPTGTMSFCMFYRVNGRGCDYSLGRWGKITLIQARTLAKQKAGEK